MNTFYFGINHKPTAGDEVFGIGIGRLYFGIYYPGYFKWWQNVYLGLTDEHGNVD